MIVIIESLDFGGPFEAKVKSGSVAMGRVELVDTGATYLWQPKSGKWLDVYATPDFKDVEYEITPEPESLRKLKDLTKFMDDIDEAEAREACGDLSIIAYRLVQIIAEQRPAADPSKSTTHNEIADDYPGLKAPEGLALLPSEKIGPKPVNPTPLMEIIGNIKAADWSKISGMANKDINKQNTGPNGGLDPVTRSQVIRCLFAFERYAREAGLIKAPPVTAEPFKYEAGVTRVMWRDCIKGVVESVKGPVAHVIWTNPETGKADTVSTPVLAKLLTRI